MSTTKTPALLAYVPVVVVLLSAFSASPVLAQATLENPAPNSFQSGVGVISGWVCEASQVEIEFSNDAANRWTAGYGTRRTDTHGVCGDTDNGFGLLFNWNLLGDGSHTVTAYADGVEFAAVTVTVTTLGGEFQRGLSQEVTIPTFQRSALTRCWCGRKRSRTSWSPPLLPLTGSSLSARLWCSRLASLRSQARMSPSPP